MSKFCDNDSSSGGYPVVSPQCYKGRATRLVTVRYNEVESDSLCLCEDCARLLKREAKRHRYQITTKRL
jgi:hypothetical protein